MMRFSHIPVCAITRIGTFPVEKTMALGGVATGSIKAIEADIVAGSMSNKGFIWVAPEIPANIGRVIFTVAVLEVSSVRKVINREIPIITING